jgi:hypothetical protein
MHAEEPGTQPPSGPTWLAPVLASLAFDVPDALPHALRRTRRAASLRGADTRKA